MFQYYFLCCSLLLVRESSKKLQLSYKKNLQSLFRLLEIFDFDIFVIDREKALINTLKILYS